MLKSNPPIFLHQPMMNSISYRVYRKSNQFKNLVLWRAIMAKGQQKKNKETKKPKQDKKVVVVSGSIVPKPTPKK